MKQNDTTIKVVDSQKWVVMSVKKEFLNHFIKTSKEKFNGKHINPNRRSLEELFVNYNIRDYIHNEIDYAVEYTINIPEVLDKLKKLPHLCKDLKAYWLNGNYLIEKERDIFIESIGK